MSLLLAPYNGAMRLGQGFNSYTHDICVDNAVVVDPQRAENVITNDGTTMRILAQKLKKASVWRSFPEYINDGQIATKDTEPVTDPHAERPIDDRDKLFQYTEEPLDGTEDAEEAAPARQESLAEQNAREDEELKQALAAAQKQTEEDKAEAEAAARAAQEPDASQMTSEELDAAQKDADAMAAANKAEDDKEHQAFLAGTQKMASNLLNAKDALDAKGKAIDKKLQARGTGMARKSRRVYKWDREYSVGTSQIVSWTSKFVDKLSEINDDKSGSAAITIKKAGLGGSGDASFVSTDRFLESDLRFYLSVKVINQSICWKDALEFNPIPAVSLKDTQKFNKVFGDSFISGFLEGGELNAVVLMKMHNKGKKSELVAQAKVALTAAAGANIDGQGNVALAMQNIAMNAETTICVTWCGGGSVKGYDEAWTIDSLIATANRFPYLCSQYPQRTYAILTKYTSLRSYIKLLPPQVSPLKYENAALYTNTLMDAYLELGALAKRIQADIAAIQSGVKRFKLEPTRIEDDPEKKSLEAAPSAALRHFKLSKFPAKLEGLDAARRTIREQMNNIVREVDFITDNPGLATQDRGYVFVGPASLQTLLPSVEYKVRKMRTQGLTGERLNKDVGANPKVAEAASATPRLFDQSTSTLSLSALEQIKVADIERADTELAQTTRVSPPVGSASTGEMFCTLDLGLQNPILSEVSLGRQGNRVRALAVTYANGLTLEFGDEMGKYRPFKAPADGKALPDDAKVRYTLSGLSESEQINSATIEVDSVGSDSTVSVIGVRFVTNQGQHLDALVGDEYAKDKKGGTGHFQSHTFEKPITDGYVSGFWGRVLNEDDDDLEDDMEALRMDDESAKITRLGLVWTQAVVREDVFDADQPIKCDAGEVQLDIDGKQSDIAFRRKLTGIPQLLSGLRQLKLKSSAEAGVGFTLEHDADASKVSHVLKLGRQIGQASASWMIAPELEDMDIQCGEVQIATNGREAVHNVELEMPFESGIVPNVLCWVVDFASTGTAVDIKTGIAQGSATALSFDIKITDGAGILDGTAKRDIPTQSITVGWLAHSAVPATGEATFQSGVLEQSRGLGIPSIPPASVTYATKFQVKPAKHFVALSAFKCGVKDGNDPARWAECRVVGSTAERLKLEVIGAPDTVLSAVWVSSL